MGNTISNPIMGLFGPKEIIVSLLGIEYSGKTTILYKLKLGQVVFTIPTIGFNVETIYHNNVSLNIWDIKGEEMVRNCIWHQQFKNAQHLIFVVDSSATDRIDEQRTALYRILDHEDAPDGALLVLANKQDMPGALSPEEVAESFGLADLKGREWHVQGTSATRDEDGLMPGIDWLTEKIKQHQKKS